MENQVNNKLKMRLGRDVLTVNPINDLGGVRMEIENKYEKFSIYLKNKDKIKQLIDHLNKQIS
jgi:hypothetical protein